jgi:hypothetical protein
MKPYVPSFTFALASTLVVAGTAQAKLKSPSGSEEICARASARGVLEHPRRGAIEVSWSGPGAIGRLSEAVLHEKNRITVCGLLGPPRAVSPAERAKMAHPEDADRPSFRAARFSVEAPVRRVSCPAAPASPEARCSDVPGPRLLTQADGDGFLLACTVDAKKRQWCTGARARDGAITARGVGPFRLGMTVAEVRALPGWEVRDEVEASEEGEEHHLIVSADGEHHLTLGLDDKGAKVESISVVSPAFATAEGVRVGWSAAEAARKLGPPSRTEWLEGTFATWAARPWLVVDLDGDHASWPKLEARGATLTAIRIK